MEKVVVTTQRYMKTSDVNEVNEYLSNGWTVKSVTTEGNKDYITAIFVLKKD